MLLPPGQNGYWDSTPKVDYMPHEMALMVVDVALVMVITDVLIKQEQIPAVSN